MPTHKLIVEYDGTDFCGWQSQASGRTVQQELERALSKVCGEPIRVAGAGRTDSGVHATGQVAAIRTSADRTPDALTRGANALLPPDVAIRAAELAPDGFDPRRDAIFRRYEYRLDCAAIRPVLDRRRVAWKPGALDLDAIRDGLDRLRGSHDFRAFRSVHCAATRTELDLDEASLEIHDPARTRLHFQFGCRSFLMNMIRVMVGSLREIGLGRLSPDIIDDMFQTGDRNLGGPTAPPEGLTLVEVVYRAQVE